MRSIERRGRKPKPPSKKKYGMLTPILYTRNGHWLCACDCGNQRIVQKSHLENGKITRCIYHPDNKRTRPKLDKKSVVKIRQQYKSGASLRALAREWKVTHQTVYLIVNYLTWSELP